MYTRLPGKFLSFFFKWLPATVLILAVVALLAFYFFFPGISMPVSPTSVSEMVKIPLDFLDLHVHRYLLETENYLIFQSFESLPPVTFPGLTLTFGLSVWLLMGIGLTLISLFDRMQFVLSMGLVIILLTLSGVNGLNIGGINTNLATMILLAGFVVPAALIHTFFFHWGIGRRVMVILPVALLTLPLLLWLGEAPSGELLVSENLSMLAMGVAALFMLYIGHAVVSSAYVLLAKLNRGVGLKISWHISIITLIYLLLFLFLLLRITGNVHLDITIPPVQVLILLVGTLGYFETKRKIHQIKQPYAFAAVGEGLYLVGFAITVLAFWKAGFSSNRPMTDFLSHIFIYSQLAFGLLFYAYLMANFGSLMNRGEQVEKVLFKPKFFAYYHMRIGSMLAMLSMVLFADGIIGVQVNAASTNISADYYYATNRTREASILYEYSWERYRRNEKAINAVAHFAIANKQPTTATNTLLRSFSNSPSVNDILLLSSSLQQDGNHAEAFTVLDKGLGYFPNNPFLLNNIALFHSRNNRAEEAFTLLEQIQGNPQEVIANKVALQTKHLIYYDERFDVRKNRAGQVNQLAFLNLKGESADFSLSTEGIGSVDPLSRAVLRNQWSHDVEDPIASDIALVDTLLVGNFNPSIEEELRETRVIRTYQQGHINESLKHLNGIAYQFPNTASDHHFTAANILIGQLDFEKAAIELRQADEKGFSDFKSEYLPILYFGGLVGKSFEVSIKHKVAFPEWMEFNEQGELIPNDTTVFFSGLSLLYTMVKAQLFSKLEEIQPVNLKSYFAYQVLLRKGHWLDRDEKGRLIGLVEEGADGDAKLEYFQDLKALYLSQERGAGGSLMDDQLLLDRNAYWTPLVFMAVEQAEGDLEKYNILLEASNFNKDPLLWINLVKYSRIVGVDHYVSSILSEMSKWVDSKTLEELQLQNL